MRFFFLALLAFFACFTRHVSGDYLGKLFGTTATEMGTTNCVVGYYVYTAGYTLGNLNGEVNSGLGDGFIIKTDLQGNIVWTKLYGTSSYDQISKLLCTSNSIYVAGYTYGNMSGQPSFGNVDVFVMEIDPDSGSVLKTKQFGGSGADFPTSLLMGSNYDFFLTGYTNSPNITSPNVWPNSACDGTNNGGYDIFVYRLNFGFYNIYCWINGTSADDKGLGMAMSSDLSTFAIVGSTKGPLFGNTNQNQDGFYAVYDGQTQFSSILYSGLIQTSGNDLLGSVTFDSSKNIIVSGSVVGDIDGYKAVGSLDIYIGKFNRSGKIWSKAYGTPGLDTATSLVNIADGTIVIGGTVSGSLWGKPAISNNSTDIFWLALKSDGTFIAAEIDGGLGADYIISIASAANANYNYYDTFFYMTGYSEGPTFLSSRVAGYWDVIFYTDSYYQAPIGKYATRGQNTAQDCQLGNICNVTGLRAPVLCPAGSYCPTLNSSIACKLGSFCLAGSYLERDCDVGLYCPNTSTAFRCDDGFYCNTTRLLKQTECPAGYYCWSVYSSPKICISGSYCPPRQMYAIPCPIGSYCPTYGMSAPLNCSDGKICNYKGQYQQYDCPEQYYCTGGLPKNCTIGSYCPPGSNASNPCPSGFYCPTTNTNIACNSNCVCPAGSTSDCVASNSSQGTNVTNSAPSEVVPLTKQTPFMIGLIVAIVIAVSIAAYFGYKRYWQSKRPFVEMNEMQEKGSSKV